jgi:NADH:ubiquinone oxidoreductase subunit K
MWNNFEYFIFLFIFLWIIILIGFCLLVFKNYLNLLILFELLMVLININFILIGIYLDDFSGQLFVLFNLGIIGCESVLGLMFLVIYYKFNLSLSLLNFVFLKG